MNHNDTVYIHRNDEHGLLAAFVSGSLNEDILISGIAIPSEKTRRGFVFDNSIDVDATLIIKNNTYNSPVGFLRDAGNVKNAKVTLDTTNYTTTAYNVNVSNLFLGRTGSNGIEKAEVIFDHARAITTNGIARDNASLNTFIFRNKKVSTISTSSYMFYNCTALNTIVLDMPGIFALANVNSFSYTPFGSSGTGGTIYIPKALYDHLGDSSSLDYKAATNWSTIDGYGHTTWAKIEGSEYEEA